MVKILLENLKNTIHNEEVALEETKQLRNVQQLLDEQVSCLTEKNKRLLKLKGENDVTCQNVKAQNRALTKELSGLKQEIQKMEKQMEKNTEKTAKDKKRHAQHVDATQKLSHENRELTNHLQNLTNTCNVLKKENNQMMEELVVLKKKQNISESQNNKHAKAQRYSESRKMASSEQNLSKKRAELPDQIQALEKSCKELKVERNQLVGDIMLLKRNSGIRTTENIQLKKQVKALERMLKFSGQKLERSFSDQFSPESVDHLSLDNNQDDHLLNGLSVLILLFLCLFVVFGFNNFSWWISTIVLIFFMLCICGWVIENR